MQLRAPSPPFPRVPHLVIRASRRRPYPRAGIWLLVTVGLGACTSFRARDDARLAIAEEAAKLAESLRSGQADAFELMEENLETVLASRTATDDHLAEIELDAFWADLGSLTGADIADEELGFAYEEHEAALASADLQVQIAQGGVKDQLERQRRLAQVIGDSANLANATTLEKLFDVVEDRLEWIDETLAKIDSAVRRVGGIAGDPSVPSVLGGLADVAGELGTGVEAARARLDEEVTKIQELQAKIDEDPNVLAATQLLLDAGQEIALSEARRLEEMRRHLSRVRQIRSELEERDRIFTLFLVAPAMAHVNVEGTRTILNGYQDDLIRPVRDSLTALKAAGRDTTAVQDAIDLLEAGKYGEAQLCELRARFAAYWGDTPDTVTITQYLSNVMRASHDRVNDGSLTGNQPCVEIFTTSTGADTTVIQFPTADEDKQSAGELGAILGLVRFVELPKDQHAALGLAAELHRHSIRMSAVNARQRLDLVHQIAEGLRIYYSGGVTPQEVAGLILEAARVLALTLIATQV